jgi:hypothetical protein
MYLHYRNTIGLEQEIPILAARLVETDEGEKIALWVRVKPEQIKQEVHFDEDEE